MKRLLLFLFFALFFGGKPGFAQDCQPDGNIVLFSNYDGGYLTIDVNQDIPNLQIGISSYEPVEVEFIGAFVGNITEIVYAGYHPLTGTGNFHCDNALAVTTIIGPPTATVTLLDYPPVTLLSPDVPIFPGSTFMIPAGDNNGITSCSSCENDTYQGGSNTAEQIIDFFATQFGGEVRWLKTQYACWCGVQSLDPPTDCCTVLSPQASVSINAVPGLQICSGGEVVLDAGPGYNSYQWSTNETGQFITVTASGTYSVQVDSDCGTAFDQVEVSFAEAPLLDLSLSNAYDCVGGTLDVQVLNTSASPGPYEYQLEDAFGNSYPINAGLAEDLPAGNYTLTVLSQSTGCESSGTFEIMAEPAFELLVESQSPDCQGGATGSINWQFTEGLTDDYSFVLVDAGGTLIAIGNAETTLSVDNLITGTYQLTVTGAQFACTETLELTLTGEAPFLVEEIIVDNACQGDAEGSIQVTIAGGQLPYVYSWTDSNGLLVGTSSTIDELLSGTYELMVEDAAGCISTFEFTVYSPVALSLNPLLEEISCADAGDGSITLQASGGASPLSYSLDGVTFQSEPIFSSLGPGTYTPLVVDANGCELQGTALDLDNPPSFSVELTASVSGIEVGEALQLTAQVSGLSGGIATYTWMPSEGLSCTDCAQPTVSGLVQTTVYTVTVVSASGCTASAVREVVVFQDKSVYIPTAFSPDFNGVNDYYQVFPGPGVAAVKTFQIFDRWGGLVFDQSFAPSGKGWDGKVGAKTALPGVYTVLVELVFLDGTTQTFGRAFTLIR